MAGREPWGAAQALTVAWPWAVVERDLLHPSHSLPAALRASDPSLEGRHSRPTGRQGAALR